MKLYVSVLRVVSCESISIAVVTVTSKLWPTNATLITFATSDAEELNSIGLVSTVVSTVVVVGVDDLSLVVVVAVVVVVVVVVGGVVGVVDAYGIENFNRNFPLGGTLPLPTRVLYTFTPVPVREG